MSTAEGGGNVITDELVLYLDAANTKSFVSGNTIWNDLSSRGNIGTLINGPTFNTGNGGSVTFDGTNDYIELTNDSRTQFTNRSQATIEAWINVSSFSGSGNRFIYCQFFTPGTTSIGIFLNTSGKFVFGYRDNVQNNSGSIKSLTSNTTLVTNVIYHVAATFEAGVATRVYINGMVDNTTVQTNNIANVNPDFIRIGRLFTDGFDFFNGRIYSIKVYFRSITPSEILQNFNANRSRFGV
jgi:hypothetical protein